MRNPSGVVWLVCVTVLSISRLAAQDVTVTDPAWFSTESSPADQPPQFKKRPKPDYPDEMKQSDRIGYAIVPKWIDEKGDVTFAPPQATNHYFEKACEGGKSKFSPAMLKGKPVDALCWYAVLFNPRTAHAKGPNATPRLLQVEPVIIAKKSLPEGVKTPFVVWATVNLDVTGAPTNFVFEDAANETFRQPIESVLPKWRFAPARQNGQAIAAELQVPFLVMGPMKPPPGKSSLPKPLNTVQLVYPSQMKQSRLTGEVVVEFVVNAKGEVTNPVILKSNNPGFDQAAIDGVLGLKFEPAIRNGSFFRWTRKGAMT
jgi:TonB family protein